MEWKPDKTSKTELEKKQSEYAKKAMDMAKHSVTRQIKPNSDKEINITIEKKPEAYKTAPAEILTQSPEIKTETAPPEEVKTKTEEVTAAPEAEKLETAVPEKSDEAVPSPIFIKSVKEAQINANFNVKGKIYKKPPEIQPYDENEGTTEKPIEADKTVCGETTDNPFGAVKPQKTESKCQPPNFREYIRKHNEQHCTCDKCCPPKKKWN